MVARQKRTVGATKEPDVALTGIGILRSKARIGHRIHGLRHCPVKKWTTWCCQVEIQCAYSINAAGQGCSGESYPCPALVSGPKLQEAEGSLLVSVGSRCIDSSYIYHPSCFNALCSRASTRFCPGPTSCTVAGISALVRHAALKLYMGI